MVSLQGSAGIQWDSRVQVKHAVQWIFMCVLVRPAAFWAATFRWAQSHIANYERPPMNVFSMMDIRTRPGQRDAAVKAFLARRVFEECAQAIPGFVEGRLLTTQDEPERMSVVAQWTDTESFTAWTKHPVRESQERDLVHFLAEAPSTKMLDVRICWDRSNTASKT